MAAPSLLSDEAERLRLAGGMALRDAAPRALSHPGPKWGPFLPTKPCLHPPVCLGCWGGVGCRGRHPAGAQLQEEKWGAIQQAPS